MMLSSQNKFISLIIVLLTMLGITEVRGEAPPPPDYDLYKIDINTDGSTGYKAVELNDTIYGLICRYSTYYDYYEYDNFEDLRVVDSKGEFVPYFLESGEGNNKLEIVRKNVNSITYKTTDIEKNTPNFIPNTIMFDLQNNNKEYVSNVEIYGSNDDTNYELITKDTIYSIDGRVKDSIELTNCKNYSYFKVVYEQDEKTPNFTSAYIKYGYNKSEELGSTTNTEGGATNTWMDYEVTQLDDTNETEIYILNTYGVYIDNIEIIANGVFVRDVEMDDNIYEIYNYTVDGVPITNTKLYFDSQKFCTEYEKKIIIRNNDDKPIDITGIIVTYRYDRVVFEDKGLDNYHLEFGNINLEQPVYDIEKLRTQVINEGYDILKFGETDIEYVFEPDEPKVEVENKFLFSLESDIDWLNIVVVGVALVLIFIVIKTIEDK